MGNPEIVLIGVAMLLGCGVFFLFWLAVEINTGQGLRQAPPRPQGRFNYSPGKHRRRKLAESRRNYPDQSEEWHQRRVDEYFDRHN
jgi:hypothetical protein